MSVLFLLNIAQHYQKIANNGERGGTRAKNMRYHNRGPDRRIFKVARRHGRNPGRANRHLYTNKDMRSW